MKMLLAAFAFALVANTAYSFPQDIPKTAEEALAKVNELVDVSALKNLNISDLSNIPNLSNLNISDLSNLNISALNNINIPGLNGSTLPINEVETLFRNKCEKNGGSFDDAKKAGADLVQCTQGLVNLATLKEEMDKARPTGDLDEVFGKYCAKKPILTKCLNDFSTAVDPCLEPIEKENKKIVLSIYEKIIGFICHKEGDRIALFVAAKGPECFQNKAMDIAMCVNSTVGAAAQNALPFNPAEGLTGLTNKLNEIKELPPLVFDGKVCRNMQTLQTCSVQHLEKCNDPTPANLMDSIFNYIKKVTPCEKLIREGA